MFSVFPEIGRADAAPVPAAAAAVENARGQSLVAILCDHASNHLPHRFGTLGLQPADLVKHFAWDPGALGVARHMARQLDAPLALSCVSRLVIDCNRDPSAPDSIVSVGETTRIPGNEDLPDEDRQRRVREVYEPFHAAAESVVEAALRRGPAAVVSVHSFTPVFKGVVRPWHVGVLFGEDERLSKPLFDVLSREAGLVVGLNEPYSPKDRVYHTLDRHAGRRGLPSVMIEVRNDLIADAEGQRAWGTRLAKAIGDVVTSLFSDTGGERKKTAGN